MGETPRAHLLDFLGDHPTSDYNLTELASKAQMTRQTAYKALEGLLGVGMVVQTRTVGQSKMYRLNMHHQVVQSILSADVMQGQEAQVAT